MNVKWPYPQTSVCLLVHDRPLVPLSPLLLEDMLHLPLGVLYDGCFYADGFR